ncbi:calymmin isoform X23 [Siniperca chuatsi]|uniref:calymmin isoform X23 n=1 Tax=Siniperca chuatsi TaxID=119488 RepID=UPI001CE1500F|nr:calymmin isoform X23 [Siniperca chuatsi]
MLGQLLLQSVVILWLVQTAHTGGVGQAMGAQNAYGGYPTKGIGYGVTNGGGMKGYGATAGVTNGQGGKPQVSNPGGNPAVLPNGNGAKSNGYGVQAGPTNGQQVKGNGYGAQAGGYGGHGTKGNGYGVQAGQTNGQQVKGNGYGAQAGGYGGHGTKGNGQGAAAGPSSGNGARPNGQGRAGSKPMKGYGRPPYGAGPGVGMGASRGLGVPQLARNERNKAYSSNGYNGYRAQPMGGYNGGYGSAGLGLGPRYGNGGMKGPKQGYGAAAGVPNGQGAKPNGYGKFPNGYGTKPNGYGATRGGAMRPQPGYGNGAVPNGYGTKPNGYAAAARAGAGGPNGYGAKPKGHGVTDGAALGGYGGKLNGYGGPSRGSQPQTTKGVGAVSPSEGAKTGYGGPAGVPNGQLAKAANTGYGMMPNGKGTKGAGASNEKGLKGRVLSPEQPSATPEKGVASQQAITQGAAPVAPEPTSGVLVMMTQEKYQKLPSPVPQGKSYKQTPVIPQATPEPAPAPAIPQDKDPMPAPEPTPEPAPMGPKAATSGPAPEPAAVLPQENGKGASISKGQGAKPAKPDCGPSGVPNGQWMKIARPGYNAGDGASTGTNTKGYGAGAGVPNGYGAKPNGYGASAAGLTNGGGAKGNKPGYEAGGYTVPEFSNGYGAGPGYPYAGKPQQPGYKQGAYLGAGYGNSYGGYGNGYSAGVQPDYASFGQGVPNANGKSGGARQLPYNGAPVVPAGLDGMSQFEPQSASLGPNGKLGSMYGGMGGLPFGGQPLGMGAEKSNTKYGIGGLQFGRQPLSTGTNGAGHYGYGGSPYGPAVDGKSSGKYGGLSAGTGGGPAPGMYGYGRMPYEAQPAGLGPEAKSTGTYGLAESPYQPETLGLGQNGKLTGKYNGGEVPYAPQALGFGSEAKSSVKYDNQGPYQSQPLESASEGRSGGEYETAGLPYEPLPLEPDSHVKGEVLTPAIAVEGEGMSIDRYENVGYINGQVQPEVVAFPAASTPSPTPAYPSVPSYLPVESSFTPDVVPGAGFEDLPDPVGAASLALDSTSATETQGVAQVAEQPDDLLQQQLPRQIHIQQHLKLHFHQPDKSGRGANNGKYDLNGFFGNSGYQG